MGLPAVAFAISKTERGARLRDWTPRKDHQADTVHSLLLRVYVLKGGIYDI
jgi:hypothetical protein